MEEKKHGEAVINECIALTDIIPDYIHVSGNYSKYKNFTVISHNKCLKFYAPEFKFVNEIIKRNKILNNYNVYPISKIKNIQKLDNGYILLEWTYYKGNIQHIPFDTICKFHKSIEQFGYGKTETFTNEYENYKVFENIVKSSTKILFQGDPGPQNIIVEKNIIAFIDLDNLCLMEHDLVVSKILLYALYDSKHKNIYKLIEIMSNYWTLPNDIINIIKTINNLKIDVTDFELYKNNYKRVKKLLE